MLVKMIIKNPLVSSPLCVLRQGVIYKMVGRLCCSAFKGFTGKSLRVTAPNLNLRTDRKYFRQGIESKESIKAGCKASGNY